MHLKTSSMRPLLLLALFCALTPIWITHREMWDGVAIEYAFETQDLSGLFHAVTASGWPIANWIYKILLTLQTHLSVPYWLGIDMLYTLAVLGMAYEVFHLTKQRLGWSNRLGTMAVILFLAHPIWHLLMSGVHMVHMVGFWFLLLGHRLTSNSPLVTRLCGWALVSLSFQFPASIVMIVWLEFVLYAEARKTQRDNTTRAVLVIAYAIAWYVASRTVFAPTQTFGGYNQLLVPTSLQSVKMIFWTGLKFASWLTVLTAPLWIGFFWYCRSRPLLEYSQAWSFKRLGNAIFAPSGVALIGCLFALAPYVAVGKGPVVVMPYDWTARNALPLALPLSMLMALMIEKLAANTAILKTKKIDDQWLLISVFLWWLGMSILGVCGKLYQIKLEKAIESSLRKISPPASGLVTLQLPFDPLIRIRHNEANGLLWRAYGRAEWAVLVSPPESWAHLIRESYVGEHPAAVKNVENLKLWSKFYVMGDLTTFNCESLIRLTLPPTDQRLSGWISLLSWSPLQLNASLEKTSCP